jgi:drug/metabolite transporter (DMT)-like permease
MAAGAPGRAGSIHNKSTSRYESIIMNGIRITGIVLIVLGLAGFFTGGFSFTKDTSTAKIGPLELVVKEKENVNFPQWLSIGAIVLGAVVLVAGSRKS